MSILPFKRLLCANRGEIAIRVFRASTELGFRTIAIFSEEDRVHLHRYKADEAYLVGKGLEPVAAYLAEDEIVELAKRHEIDAIHPGYGLLSERASFARKCRDAGIVFIGPTPEAIDALGDKIAARKIAEAAGVPVVPGTAEPLRTLEAARAFADKVGYPVLVKAAAGGGGRGMRVVRAAGELAEALERARSEARKAFGDDSVFLEKLVVRPKHIEVQVLGDNHGNLVHLFERDCSVQRRHQKVVEYAPAWSLPEALRARLAEDALKVARQANYTNAGTVEFLVGRGRQPLLHRGQPAHPGRAHGDRGDHRAAIWCRRRSASRRATSCPIPRSASPTRQSIQLRGVAIQVRVTAEDPKNDFLPDTGKISVYRPAVGLGIRLDDGSGYVGARVSPFYDSLLAKITASGLEWNYARRKAIRSLREFRIRGVKTNIHFLENVLAHPTFIDGKAHTTFIDETPALVQYTPRRDRATRILRYVASTIVNGHATVRGKPKPPPRDPEQPSRRCRTCRPRSPRRRRRPAPSRSSTQRGPEGLVRWLKENRRVHLTDTTWRDAHQSLLATRVRTYDLARIAPATAHLCADFFSLEMWGGATFDVAYRFLSEDPVAAPRGAAQAGAQRHVPDAGARRERRRLHQLPRRRRRGVHRGGGDRRHGRVPHLRRAQRRRQHDGRDRGGAEDRPHRRDGDLLHRRRLRSGAHEVRPQVLRRHGQGDLPARHAPAVHQGHGGPAEAARGDDAGQGAQGRGRRAAAPAHARHRRATRSARTWRPSTPASTSSTARSGIMAGMTSQPSLSSLAFALAGSPRDPHDRSSTGIEKLSHYWEPVREWYAPFESGLKAPAADVYEHEIPGGQYSNLRAQAEALGVGAGVGGGQARLRRRQPPVRRHPQGDAELEGRRRHGDLDGEAGAGRARRSPSARRS